MPFGNNTKYASSVDRISMQVFGVPTAYSESTCLISFLPDFLHALAVRISVSELTLVNYHCLKNAWFICIGNPALTTNLQNCLLESVWLFELPLPISQPTWHCGPIHHLMALNNWYDWLWFFGHRLACWHCSSILWSLMNLVDYERWC